MRLRKNIIPKKNRKDRIDYNDSFETSFNTISGFIIIRRIAKIIFIEIFIEIRSIISEIIVGLINEILPFINTFLFFIGIIYLIVDIIITIYTP